MLVSGQELAEHRPHARFQAVTRVFNTTGPCDIRKHYMVPAEARLPEARPLIEAEGYFVLHAPRQSGKTTTLRALATALTAEGRYAALHFSCEAGEVAGDEYGAAEEIVIQQVEQRARGDLPERLRPPPRPEPRPVAGSRLGLFLSDWARACPRPLVLFFDEIDALRGPSLLTVLRQLRAGFPHRPAAFPASVVLCGLRDVRDYKVASGGDPDRLGTSSPFNIKVKSIRLGDFSEEESRHLHFQHTEETGQEFRPDALARAWEVTQGQPWLVNALAREIIDEMGTDHEPIGREHVEAAKERLILARATHLDSLVARLQEPRVRRVIEPIISGESVDREETYDDDVLFCRDLGLVSGRPLRVANPIYREVIVRLLSTFAEDQIDADPRTFVLPDGRLNLQHFLSEFAGFWKEHGDVLPNSMPYPEVAPQLVLMAYLQRVVNGGGYVDREYGVGRGRIDLLVRWPWRDGEGRRQWQREALELKVWRDGRPDPLARGLEQLDAYLAGLGVDEGVLVIFDRRAGAPSAGDRTRSEEARTASGRRVTVVRA